MRRAPSVRIRLKEYLVATRPPYDPKWAASEWVVVPGTMHEVRADERVSGKYSIHKVRYGEQGANGSRPGAPKMEDDRVRIGRFEAFYFAIRLRLRHGIASIENGPIRKGDVF